MTASFNLVSSSLTPSRTTGRYAMFPPCETGPMHAAVLGSPVDHSLSPVLHTAAYTAPGLHDWDYTAHECTEDALAAFVDGLDDSWAGLSLTMPLKRVALDVATEVSPLAAAI